MNATLQIRPATTRRPASRLARAYAWVRWIRHARAKARARRRLAEVDARTLRDIGFTRRDIAVISLVGYGR
jgi:uncharacterized protein YjiS (DUF1127 family)